MIGHISYFIARFVSRWLPDPLILAMLLTLLTFVIALWLTLQTPISTVKTRGDGFWNLLTFGMQMVLIIVTSHALASSAPVRSLLRTAASVAKTPVQGVMLVIFFGSVAYIINWGFDLVVGAMFAREVARRVPSSDYSSFIVCAYIGFLTWGDGFSGSMPLLAIAPDNPVEHTIGPTPVSDTLFSGFSIFITVVLIMVMPLITYMMMPKPSDVVSIDPKLPMEKAGLQKQLPKDAPPSERLEESHIPTLIIDAFDIAYLAVYFSEHSFNITTDTVNLMLMTVGLLLYKTPVVYMHAINAVARSVAGALMRLPLYTGIQLMMEHSGLGGLITEFFINVTNKDTSPVVILLSSALVNFVALSGGGHWVIQEPFAMPAVRAPGADLGKLVVVIVYGKQWMDMVQPFWALSVLAIVKLGVYGIMGYCITALLSPGVIFVIGLALF